MHLVPGTLTRVKGVKEHGEFGVLDLFLTEWLAYSCITGYLLFYGCFITLTYFLAIIFCISRGEQCPINDGFYYVCLCISFLFIFICYFVRGGNIYLSLLLSIHYLAVLYLYIF